MWRLWRSTTPYTETMVRLLLIAAAVSAFAASISDDYVQQVEKWRQAREDRLKADDGWLSVAGLFWLNEGSNTIKLPPGSESAAVGTFELHKGKVTYHIAGPVPPGASPEMEMKPDTSGEPTELHVNDLTMFVIQRADRFAIRLKDKNSPYRRDFTGLNWYPVKPEYRVEARFVGEAKKIPILNVVGQTDQEDSPGHVEFELQGKPLRMVALTEGDTLFFVFRDQTSGHTTYGASRMMNTAMPKDGRVALDFNEAYNPPCAFTPYATCPLPPHENRLGVAIEAGEMNYGKH